MKRTTRTTFTATAIAAVVLVVLVATSPNANAQSTSPNPLPTRPPWDGALEIRFPIPTTCPPLTTDMPLDVFIGYVGGDSLARRISSEQVDSLYRVMPYSDTLRQALKYLYRMTDYNPIRLFQWSGTAETNPVHYLTPTENLRNLLYFRARVAYPDTQRTAVLCAADIIAHVRVTSTQTKIDTNAVSAKHATLVTCTIIDPIKGKRIPNCWIDYATKERNQSILSATPQIARAEGVQPAIPGNCLQFEISPEWPLQGGKTKPSYPSVKYRMLPDSSLADGFNGSSGPWVRPNTEYIVFLKLRGLGIDSVLNDGHFTKYHYATLFPISWFGYTCSLYPVVNGIVYDPHNDFGFGANLTPIQFATALRSRISSIINP